MFTYTQHDMCVQLVAASVWMDKHAMHEGVSVYVSVYYMSAGWRVGCTGILDSSLPRWDIF